MGEVLFWLLTVGLTAYLSWSLGVRRERGRQMRIEEIREAERARRSKSGVKMNRLKIRR